MGGFQVYQRQRFAPQPSAWERFKGAMAEGLAQSLVGLPAHMAGSAITTSFGKGGGLWEGVMPSTEVEAYRQEQAAQLEQARTASELARAQIGEIGARKGKIGAETLALEAMLPEDVAASRSATALRQAQTGDVALGREMEGRGLDIEEMGVKDRTMGEKGRLGLGYLEYELAKERHDAGLKAMRQGGGGAADKSHPLMTAFLGREKDRALAIAGLEERKRRSYKVSLGPFTVERERELGGIQAQIDAIRKQGAADQELTYAQVNPQVRQTYASAIGEEPPPYPADVTGTVGVGPTFPPPRPPVPKKGEVPENVKLMDRAIAGLQERIGEAARAVAYLPEETTPADRRLAQEELDDLKAQMLNLRDRRASLGALETY